jgi:tetrahydromethanopterin S-methyltransferase subunit F
MFLHDVMTGHTSYSGSTEEQLAVPVPKPPEISTLQTDVSSLNYRVLHLVARNINCK